MADEYSRMLSMGTTTLALGEYQARIAHELLTRLRAQGAPEALVTTVVAGLDQLEAALRTLRCACDTPSPGDHDPLGRSVGPGQGTANL